DLVARQLPCPAVIQAYLERFRRYKTPGPHDQFGAAGLVSLQMEINFAVDHVALALANLCHVGCDGTGRSPSARRDAPDVRLPRSKSHSCWAGRRCWDRSPQSTGALRRQSVASIAPYAKPVTYHPVHCQGSGLQTVLVET